MQGDAGGSIEIEALWEYADPAMSESRFRAALEGRTGDTALELMTQVARTYSLRGRFDEAHRVLDQVHVQLKAAGIAPRVRYLLERGRTFNSAGDKEKARKLFVHAFEQAQAGKLEGLAVDAAHMVAVAHAGTEQALEWNRRGLALARASKDARSIALIPAMLNNQAWDLHAMGRYPEALALFEEAQKEWSARERPKQVHIAKWSVARCLRSLGRHDEALAIQRALQAEQAAMGTTDPHVDQEIAENLKALGR
jgi:tetratricopeptide (TPR) repeat protein